MRVNPVLPALLLCVAGPAFAQGQADPIKYVSRTDYFSIDFPGAPKVQEITYPDEYRINLPGRVYASAAGRNRYKVTVVDYRGALQIHAARNAKCLEDAGANRPGLTPSNAEPRGDSCQDDGGKGHTRRDDVRDMDFVEKAAKVTQSRVLQLGPHRRA